MKNPHYNQTHRKLCALAAHFIELISKRNEILEDIATETSKKKKDQKAILYYGDELVDNFHDVAEVMESLNSIYDQHIGVTDSIFFVDDFYAAEESIDKKILDALEGEQEDDRE